MFTVFVIVSVTHPLYADPVRCDSLRVLSLKDTTITVAEPVQAGALSLPQADARTATFLRTLPSFCRVAGVLAPTSDSHIEFEVWMPMSDWNQRFEGVDNGGFAGSINYRSLASALLRGYATASTDTGHKAHMDVDGTWALGHPEKIVDFGYRAIHLTAQNAKAILQAFYGNAPSRSFFVGCSNGGRQALMEAQRYPADYDGIIAGAPANFWTHLLTAAIWDAKATLADPDSYISALKLPAIEAAALTSCDASDGLKDGLIADPSRCHFDSSALLCKGPESETCLTHAQVAALNKIYSGPHTAGGELIHAGYVPGGETGPGGWATWITGDAPRRGLIMAFGTQFFSNFVFDDAGWDFRTFNFDRDTKIADQKLAGVLNATDPDLSAFKRRGGKLIMYHGWSDAAISALNSISYYKSVVARLGQAQTSSFVELFLAPGMQHCAGGPGPDLTVQPGVQRDPEADIDRALARWVETNTAPRKLVATKHKQPGNFSSEVLRTRPLCPYPEIAQYKGTGSIDDAANFVCEAGH